MATVTTSQSLSTSFRSGTKLNIHTIRGCTNQCTLLSYPPPKGPRRGPMCRSPRVGGAETPQAPNDRGIRKAPPPKGPRRGPMCCSPASEGDSPNDQGILKAPPPKGPRRGPMCRSPRVGGAETPRTTGGLSCPRKS